MLRERGDLLNSTHPAPFQELESGEDIHTDGGDADCPFSVRAEGEPRSH